jgi:aminotransferase
MRERTLLVSGFAKTYAMDGWRLGFVAAPRDLIRWALRVHQYTTVCAPTFAQYGAVAALDGPQADRDRMVAAFADRRAAALDYLCRQDSLRVVPTRGAFYLYVSYAQSAPAADRLALDLLEDQAVAVVPGTGFDDPEGHHSLRISYAAPKEDVLEGLNRIVRYVGRLS